MCNKHYVLSLQKCVCAHVCEHSSPFRLFCSASLFIYNSHGHLPALCSSNAWPLNAFECDLWTVRLILHRRLREIQSKILYSNWHTADTFTGRKGFPGRTLVHLENVSIKGQGSSLCPGLIDDSVKLGFQKRHTVKPNWHRWTQTVKSFCFCGVKNNRQPKRKQPYCNWTPLGNNTSWLIAGTCKDCHKHR